MSTFLTSLVGLYPLFDFKAVHVGTTLSKKISEGMTSYVYRFDLSKDNLLTYGHVLNIIWLSYARFPT